MKSHLLLTTIAAVVLVGCGEKTPSIWIAARDGNLEIVKKHLINGVDINAKDKEGDAPLHKAVARGNEEIVEYLINKGASLNIKDNWERTPLHWVTLGGRKKVAELLITKGADVNAKDENDRTPLDFTPAPKKTEESESGDLNLGVPAISMGGESKIRTYLRKHGGKTSEELKAEGK